MSDNDLGKKLVEEEHLFQFLEAYKTVTGATLAIRFRSESPDFICECSTGERIGVELARAPHDHDMAVYDRIWSDRTLPSSDLLASIGSMVAKKERKRRLQGWPNTILVIQLLDYTFQSWRWTAEDISDDFADTGFREIWIADHFTMEPFGQPRLIGLYPRDIFGLHDQPALEGKPYG